MSSHESTTASFVLDIQYHTIQGAFVQTVDARRLHERLGHQKNHFTDWLTGRIEEYGFVREIDYLVFPREGKNPLGGRPNFDYFLTLDMAKELCMLDRSYLGSQARRYFIDCEKALMQGGGVIVQRLEEVEYRLTRLEQTQIPIPQAMSQPRSQPRPSHDKRTPLPAPQTSVREHAEISTHLVAVWRVMRNATVPLDNREIAQQSGIGERTTRAHTRYLMQLGFLSVYETHPRHLYIIDPEAKKRSPGYWQRLEHISAIVEARRGFNYEDLRLLGKA